MSDRISNDELDWLVWLSLRDSDVHPTRISDLVNAAGTGGRIDRRMRAMKKTGQIRLHKGPRATYPAHVRSHGWEVIGCPGDGGSEDGQWHWREGCDDCTRRTRPDPADGVIEPPPIVAFECELRVEP